MLPSKIPRFELGTELGRGAYSVVLRGTRDQVSYAVKMPLGAETEAERHAAFRRFLHEAVALARVRHPYLPAVMEVGRAEGVPYLVMELAAGETLSERIERGPLAEPQAIELGQRIAGALAAIHDAGLVHRDVKPRNIVFDQSSNGVRLVDLGSAAVADHEVSAAGTRSYAAPELLGNDVRTADARADLYSLGRVLVECLGVPLSPGAAGELRTFVDHGVSEEFTRILLRLVAPTPDARPQSAAALLAELGSLKHAREHMPPSRSRFRLLGRDASLDQMRRMWVDAQRAGRIVLIEGAAGSGKTKLAHAFLDDLRLAGVTVLAASCRPREPRAFSAVRQLIEDYLRQLESRPERERARGLSELQRVAGDLASTLKLLSPALARIFKDAPTLPASENAEQAFAEAVADFLEKLIRKTGPSLVFVDDVQWLDASSRRVLSRAANRVAELKGLFLFTVREHATSGAATLMDVISAPMARIRVGNLSNDEIIELARDFLAARELATPVKQAILRLSDGMPLGTLEVLRTLVDEGVLLPYWGRWQLDNEALLAMHLPSEASSLLRRRIGALEPGVRSILSVAAVIGGVFEVKLLMQLEGDSVPAILDEARWSQLVEPGEDGTCRFIHQTIPETLLSMLDAGAISEIHGRVALALDQVPPGSFHARGSRPPDFTAGGANLDADPIYRVAYHYGLARLDVHPERAAETNVIAGLAAEARFDNERAKAFFETAETALGLLGRSLEAQTRLSLAEARLRVGEHEGAIEEFNRALASSVDPILRAKAWGRIAFVHVMQMDTKRAWAALSRGFAELGERLPTESPAYAVGSVGAWLARLLPSGVRALAPPSDPQRDELMCSLYYEAGRVAFASNQPARIVLSALRALEPADRLGPSAAQAKTYLAYAFVLTVLGLPSLGARYLATSEEVGRRLRDPVIYSHALQLQCVIAAWAGRFQDAIDAASRCVLQYGHWRELADYCVNCYNLFQLEASRGRDIEAWKWVDVAVARVNGHDGAPVVPEYVLLAARAALVGLGRESDARVLLQRLERVTVPIPSDSGAYAMTFSPRVRRFTDKGDLGPEFRSVLDEFRGLQQDPKRAPPAVAEYYLHIAHAFVHRALRALPSDKKQALADLQLALSDLRATARHFPVFKAHHLAVAGYEHLFHGRLEAAHGSFDEAERLAIAETVPWVQYAVYRGRAHALREAGRLDGARDMAVLADSVAMQHGSLYRARWVREEFGLRARLADGEYLTGSHQESPGFDETATLAPGGSRARRQLRALLRISRARAQELAPDHQARVVVDEVVQALRASRGFLFLTASVARVAEDAAVTSDGNSELVLIAGRDVDGHDLGEHEDYHRNVVRDALLSAEFDVEERKARAATTARYCAIAAPLVVDDVAAGVIYLDRPLGAGPFADVDGEVLGALAGQVSVALELTQTLRARERAEESLRNAEKMEAVARLARGIAHDLNNMLSAIRLATVAMMTEPGAGTVVGEDVRTIQSALQRANELTKQLGTFSRGELASPQPIRLTARIERLLPVMEGLVGDTITIEARAPSRVPAILIDPDQFDQVLMNLFVNARDAMPRGGKISLEVSEVKLDEAYRREHPRVEPGRYVRLVVSDTGVGIDEKIRHKIFEPYFTTKEERGGTGLGLSSVYWVVSQGGGHVDVSSVPGAGATFTVHFPVAFVPSAHADSRRGRRSRHSARQTVLVVDQDPISGREVGQMLAEHGYRVLTARSGAEALALGRKRQEAIDVLVANVVMEGMNGLELARELRAERPDLPVLLVSSDASGVLAERGILGGEVEILNKPVASDLLARRVKTALGRAQRGATPK